MFALVYSNQDENVNRFKTRTYSLPKSIIKNCNSTKNKKKLYDQAIDSNKKWYEEIRELTTDQGEDYTTGCIITD